jgi:hypothetical protein
MHRHAPEHTNFLMQDSVFTVQGAAEQNTAVLLSWHVGQACAVRLRYPALTGFHSVQQICAETTLVNAAPPVSMTIGNNHLAVVSSEDAQKGRL